MFATLRKSRGVVLRKAGGVLGAVFQFAGGVLVASSGSRMSFASVAGGFALILVAALAVLAVIAAAFGGDVVSGLALATAPALVVKNRAANEFRVEAEKIRTELLDPKVTLTVDEVNKRAEAMKALEQRAQMAAEFTADKEIERQGGEEGLTRIDVGAEKERANFEQVEDVRAKIVKVAANGGFRSLGEFLRVVSKKQEATTAQLATLGKMRELSRAITGSGSAEVLLPLQQEKSIFSVSNAQNGILPRARRYSVAGETLRIPTLIQDEGTNTLNRPMAGKIANIVLVDQAAEKPQREPQFRQRLVTVYKAAATTQLSDEILADDMTGQLASEITEAVGTQVLNKFDELVTADGTGTGMPLGALNAANGALMVVDRATANDVTADDVFAMYARHTHGPNSVWFASRYLMQKLMQLTLNGTSLVSWLSNLRDKPQMMLLGIPVVITDLVPTLGSQGDLSLVNPEFYAVGMRQGLTVESSIHEFFSYDITVYRFLARIGGVPLPEGTFAYKYAGGAKIDPHSPFTVLGLPASS